MGTTNFAPRKKIRVGSTHAHKLGYDDLIGDEAICAYPIMMDYVVVYVWGGVTKKTIHKDDMLEYEEAPTQ